MPGADHSCQGTSFSCRPCQKASQSLPPFCCRCITTYLTVMSSRLNYICASVLSYAADAVLCLAHTGRGAAAVCGCHAACGQRCCARDDRAGHRTSHLRPPRRPRLRCFKLTVCSSPDAWKIVLYGKEGKMARNRLRNLVVI